MPNARWPIPDAAALQVFLAGMTRPSRIRGMEGTPVPDPVAKDLLAYCDLQALWVQLSRLGVKDLAHLGAGASSVVLDVGDGLAVRLGLGAPLDMPRIEGVIQPLARGTAGTARFELMPLADTDGVTEADLQLLAEMLDAQGYRFSDAGLDNIGRVDGQLVVIDPGAVERARPAATPHSTGSLGKGLVDSLYAPSAGLDAPAETPEPPAPRPR